MSNSKINRLDELNKIWFRLNTPKVGDTVKFKISGYETIFDGKIVDVQRDGMRFAYKMVSENAPAGFMNSGKLQLVEWNGKPLNQQVSQVDDDEKNFKPL